MDLLFIVHGMDKHRQKIWVTVTIKKWLFVQFISRANIKAKFILSLVQSTKNKQIGK